MTVHTLAGTPRLQQSVLRLYRSVLPCGDNHAGSTLPQRMLLFAGESLCLPPASMLAGTKSDSEGFSSVHWSVGVQAVYFLRVLLGVPAWRDDVRAALEQALVRGCALLREGESSCVAGESTGDGVMNLSREMCSGHLLSSDRATACSLGAALAVLGGLIDGLRPGASVCYADEEEGCIGLVTECHHDSAVVRVSALDGTQGTQMHISQVSVCVLCVQRERSGGGREGGEDGEGETLSAFLGHCVQSEMITKSLTSLHEAHL